MADYILAIDQGTTSTRAIIFDKTGSHRRVRAARARADLPEGGLGRARPDGDLAQHARGDRPGARQGRPHPARHRRGRHHQPARDRRGLGQEHRRAGLQRDRLAGHPHPAHRRPPRGRRRRRAVQAATSGCRWPPTSPAPRSRGSSRTSRARASGPRPATCSSAPPTRGCSGTSPAASTAACTRPMSRTPAARCSWISRRSAGATTSSPPSACPGRCCPRSGRSSEVYGNVEPSSLLARGAGRRHPRRPAGRDVRAGARSTPASRRTPTAPATSYLQHGHGDRALEERAAHDPRLQARRPAGRTTRSRARSP